MSRRKATHSGVRGLRQEATFMVHVDRPVGLDRVAVVFDDERAAADGRRKRGAAFGYTRVRV